MIAMVTEQLPQSSLLLKSLQIYVVNSSVKARWLLLTKMPMSLRRLANGDRLSPATALSVVGTTRSSSATGPRAEAWSGMVFVRATLRPVEARILKRSSHLCGCSQVSTQNRFIIQYITSEYNGSFNTHRQDADLRQKNIELDLLEASGKRAGKSAGQWAGEWAGKRAD